MRKGCGDESGVLDIPIVVEPVVVPVPLPVLAVEVPDVLVAVLIEETSAMPSGTPSLEILRIESYLAS